MRCERLDLALFVHCGAGAVDLKIPKFQKGSYLPAFLKPRWAAEKALAAFVQES